MNETAKHAPRVDISLLPWAASQFRDRNPIEVRCSNNVRSVVAYVPLGPRAEDNAAFIVRACNSHDALVEALQDARDYFDQRADAEYLPGQAAPTGIEEMTLYVQIVAALAQARG